MDLRTERFPSPTTKNQKSQEEPLGNVTDIRPAKLRRALTEQGRTVTWLAQQMNLSRPYVSSVLSGVRPWTDGFGEAAMRALDTKATKRDLFRGRAITLPANLYREAARAGADPSVIGDVYEAAWKASWLAEHGSESLAAAAERAWQQATTLAGAR